MHELETFVHIRVHVFSTVRFSNYGVVFPFAAICADGSYYKYSFDNKGESHIDTCCKFLQMTDE